MATPAVQSGKTPNVWNDPRISKRFECPETQNKSNELAQILLKTTDERWHFDPQSPTAKAYFTPQARQLMNGQTGDVVLGYMLGTGSNPKGCKKQIYNNALDKFISLGKNQ